MLNKELMLNSKPDEPHILLTVDENESYYYGYIYQDLGSVNRRPYWVIDEDRYHLFELYYDESFYNVTGLSFDPFPAPKMYLRITINGASHTFNIGYPFEDGANGDFFDLKSKVGKTISVTFDPPPTGTSIHNSHEASTEESIDAQQGITVDGRWGKTHRESYPKLQFKRRRRIYSSKRCVHRESGVFRQQSNTSNRNCHNSCKYRRSATFRNTSNIHSECPRYDWFRFQCWNIHSIRKQCIDKYQATNLLIVLMEALYA